MTDKLELKYFVLKPCLEDIYGKASIAAMRTYAAIIADENPEFAKGIEDWAYHAELGPQNEHAKEVSVSGVPYKVPRSSIGGSDD